MSKHQSRLPMSVTRRSVKQNTDLMSHAPMTINPEMRAYWIKGRYQATRRYAFHDDRMARRGWEMP